MNKPKQISINEPIFRQFKNKPRAAILHLMKVKEGEAVKALYRKEVGFIDLVWGENDSKNRGYGLKHIIEKHGESIIGMGFKIEHFIPHIILNGKFTETTPNKNKSSRKVFEGDVFRFVVESEYKGKEKIWLLTAFDLSKKPGINPGIRNL